MTISLYIFYFFAAILVGSAAMVVIARNPVHAALFLVLAFFSSAAVWLMMEAEFLAIVLVLVYVGAVMVLFLFVIMMLDINVAPLREGFARYLPIGLIVAAAMALSMGLVLKSAYFDAAHLDVFGGPGEDSMNGGAGNDRFGFKAPDDGVDTIIDFGVSEDVLVIDASVFPTIPSSNTNAPAIMVGERGAEFVLEDAAS